MRTWFALCVSACFWTTAATADGDAAVRDAVRANTLLLADGTYAVPLIGDPPDWYTPEVREKAHAASAQGLAYDFLADENVAPASAPSQVLIRPGTQIFPKGLGGGWCTAGFVFKDNNNAMLRIATAGHCTEVNDEPLALSAPSTIFAIGKTKFRKVHPDPTVPGDDWALIDIDPQWWPFTDGDVALVGGPCGSAPTAPAVPLLKYVGHGLAVGTGGTPRAGIHESSAPDTGAFRAMGPANRGDSGAPVLEAVQSAAATDCATGGALGILTHTTVIDVSPGYGVGTGTFFGTLISKVINTPGYDQKLYGADLLPISSP